MPLERRLFVGIFPPAEIGRALHEAAREVLPASEFRLVPADEVHLTLRFLGATAEDAIPAVRAALGRDLAGFLALSLSIRGTGAFPDGERARVLWAGIAEEGDGLDRLAKAAGETKPFHPHLTLARGRNARAPRGFLALPFDLAWTPTEVLLVESRPGAAGPDRFPRIEAFPLSPDSR